MSEPGATARDVITKMIGNRLYGYPEHGNPWPKNVIRMLDEVSDTILAALHAAGLTIVERGMVCVPLEDARILDRGFHHIYTFGYPLSGVQSARNSLKAAIARAEEPSGEGEG